MTEYSTLVDLLRDRAFLLSDQTAYTFLPDGETESGSLTYQDLDQQARAIASQLQSLMSAGSRALVVYPYTAGLEFIAAFFGCLYAGVIAVTDNPPVSRQGIPKLQTRVESCQPSVILTTQSLLTDLKTQLSQNPEFAPSLNDLPWIATDLVPLEHANNWVEPQLTTDTLAFLQYTSGSTGIPKGVRVTHRNVLHNSAIIYQAFEHTANSRGLIWLPMFHDMGLIGGVVQPLYGGFPVVLMSPVALIQKPLRWLQGISRYQATTSGGPNFAYDLLCRQVTPEQLENLDLRSWDVAFSGAEPVRAETLDRFAKIFAACGFRREAFYPCYGMAETTLFISGGVKTEFPRVLSVDSKALEQNQVVFTSGEQGGSRSVVSCGRGWLGDEIVIVDPESLTLCSELQVGEIWVAGTGVGLGYWNQPEETEQTFQGYVEGRGPFLRTGDLGFLDQGELFITGRIKEMMILWGRNRYPQDIEMTVEKSHPALRAGYNAAFSVEVDGEEQLVIAQEVERQFLRKLNEEEIIGAIRQAVAEQHTVDVYAIALLKTGSIPKTTSGKIQRRACRTRFLEGTLEAIALWNRQTEPNSLSELAQRSQVRN